MRIVNLDLLRIGTTQYCYKILAGKGIFFLFRSIERAAVHEARRHEQTAKGNLEKNKLENERVCLIQQTSSVNLSYCLTCVHRTTVFHYTKQSLSQIKAIFSQVFVV